MNPPDPGPATLNEANALLCPMCGGSFTHAERVYEIPAFTDLVPEVEQHQIEGVSDLRREVDSWRREALAIEFKCELGCRFRMRLQQHKGETLVTLEIQRWRAFVPKAAVSEYALKLLLDEDPGAIVGDA